MQVEDAVVTPHANASLTRHADVDIDVGASTVADPGANAAKGADSSLGSDASPSGYTTIRVYATTRSDATTSSIAAPGSGSDPDGYTERGARWLVSPRACPGQDGADGKQPGGWYPRH